MTEDVMDVGREKEQYTCVSISTVVTLGQTIARLQEQLKEANELLSCFLDESPCRFDHNGCCQEHNSCENGGKCIQKDLKEYLKKWGVK